MKKCLLIVLIALQFSCGDGGSAAREALAEETQELASNVHVLIDMTISNFSPAPLKEVVIDLPLAVSLAGFQTVSTFRVDGASSEKLEIKSHEGLSAIARIDVGDLGPREKINQTIDLTFSYQEGVFPFSSFKPFDDISKAIGSEIEKTEENNTAIAEVGEVTRRPIESEAMGVIERLLSEEDHAFLDSILKLQQSGQDVYVFSGVVCPKQKTCQFTEKTVWLDYPGSINRGESVDNIHFVFEVLRTEERLKNVLANKKRFVVSNAVVELR